MAPRLPAVMDASGRLLPFDRGRLTASMAASLPDPEQGVRAGDLSAVIAAWLSRPEQSPVVGAEELARLAGRVLGAVGEGRGVRRYLARRRRAPAGLPFGGPAATAAGGAVAMDSDPYDRLDPLEQLGRVAGPEAENRLAQRVIADRVVGPLLPGGVVAAERAGLVRLDSWIAGARVPAARLASDWVASRRGPDLGAQLRALLGLVTHELTLPWTGRLPSVREWIDLLRHLQGSAGGQLVLELPARRLRQLAPLAACLEQRPTSPVSLRLVGRPASAWRPERWPSGAGRLAWAAVPEEPGLVVGGAVLDLARVAGCGGGGGVVGFLALVEELAAQALAALSRLAPVGLDQGPRSALSPHAPGGRRWRLMLTGHAALERLLLGERAPEVGRDLLVAVGERLARASQAAGCDLPGPVDLRLVPVARRCSPSASDIDRAPRSDDAGSGPASDPPCPAPCHGLSLQVEQDRRRCLGLSPVQSHELPAAPLTAADWDRLFVSSSLAHGSRPCA